jgi:hypothetical protein
VPLLQLDEVPLAAFVVVVPLKTSKAHGRARAGHPVAEASIAHQAGLLVRLLLLQAGKVLSGAIAVAAVAAPLEATMAVAAPGALTEEALVEVAVSLETPKAVGALEVMEEVTAKLKELGREKDPCGPSFLYSIPAGILSFTHLPSRSKLVCLKNLTPP